MVDSLGIIESIITYISIRFANFYGILRMWKFLEERGTEADVSKFEEMYKYKSVHTLPNNNFQIM